MRLSIIIPTLNRAKFLEITLNSIAQQHVVSPEVEVIVVDNGSTDLTKDICDNFKKKISNFNYTYDNEPGLLTGRHKGAEIAKGEVLCFLDDDVILNSNYVENLILLFEKNKDVQLATGPCLPNYEINPPDWLKYFWNDVPDGKYCAWFSLLDLGNKEIEIDPNFVWGLNFNIRKSTFVELGGFHPDCIPDYLQQYQGDGETGLTLKAKKNGFKALYSADLSLQHQVPASRLTIDYFKKRAFYQGICDSYTHLRNKNEGEILKPGLLKKIRNKLHPYYRWIKQIYQTPTNNNLPKEIEGMMVSIGESEKKGYAFHQNHFNTNEQVRNWVIKPNYWDYKLPKS